jgi:hypothetical protein
MSPFRPQMLEPLHPLQIDAWRKMTPTEKMDLVTQAQQIARDAIRQRLKRQHPEWEPSKIEKETSRALIHAHT